MLLTGGIGTGRTLLGLMISSRNAAEGLPALYVSFEESAEQLGNTLEALPHGRESGAVKNLHLVSLCAEAFTPASLYDEIVKAIEEVRPRVVVLDGVESIMRRYGVATGLDVARALVMLCKERGAVSVLTVLPGLTARLGALCDTVIRLHRVRKGFDTKYYLRVIKHRGSLHDLRAREYTFTERGIEFVKG